MISYWKSFSYTSKFSVIAFFITLVLGLLSMGILGAGLYYVVSFLFFSYPSLNDWRGDWVWPATIGVGMGWSLGFIFGGIALHYLDKISNAKYLKICIYILILWLWAACLWYFTLKSNF